MFENLKRTMNPNVKSGVKPVKHGNKQENLCKSPNNAKSTVTNKQTVDIKEINKCLGHVIRRH